MKRILVGGLLCLSVWALASDESASLPNSGDQCRIKLVTSMGEYSEIFQLIGDRHKLSSELQEWRNVAREYQRDLDHLYRLVVAGEEGKAREFMLARKGLCVQFSLSEASSAEVSERQLARLITAIDSLRHYFDYLRFYHELIVAQLGLDPERHFVGEIQQIRARELAAKRAEPRLAGIINAPVKFIEGAMHEAERLYHEEAVPHFFLQAMKVAKEARIATAISPDGEFVHFVNAIQKLEEDE